VIGDLDAGDVKKEAFGHAGYARER
jgi:hypothetical protein